MTNQKVVLITGASSGIGEATAERLAKAGYKSMVPADEVPKQASNRSIGLRST